MNAVFCIRYNTIETKEVARIGYSRFFPGMNTQVKEEMSCPKAFTCVELIVTKWLISFFT